MAKKTAEQPLTLANGRRSVASNLTFGAKSVVSGEEYVDPNAADWDRYHQKMADREKERLQSLDAG
jgi:hypothetical protein